jgi:hypothetical protein
MNVLTFEGSDGSYQAYAPDRSFYSVNRDLPRHWSVLFRPPGRSRRVRYIADDLSSKQAAIAFAEEHYAEAQRDQNGAR